MVDCKDGDLSTVFCNTTFCRHCSSSCSFFHGNDPRIILLPWQPLVNLVWPSPVIQCLSIHLHSLHLCLSCCKLPLFIYIFFLHHSPHSVIHFFFPLSPPVWVYRGCCYTSSQYIYTSWCHTSGDSLFICMHWSPAGMLPSLTQWFKLAGVWLLVAELQVQINQITSQQRNYCFCQPGTQARFKCAGKYWY